VLRLQIKTEKKNLGIYLLEIFHNRTGHYGKAKANSVTLFYEEAGSGDPSILLVHGGMYDHTHFVRIYQQFCDRNLEMNKRIDELQITINEFEAKKAELQWPTLNESLSEYQESNTDNDNLNLEVVQNWTDTGRD
jgi:hypothetical protein